MIKHITRLSKLTSNKHMLQKIRHSSSKGYNKELSVSPFCKVQINLSQNIKILPLDVFKYQSNDKIIINCTDDTIKLEEVSSRGVTIINTEHVSRNNGQCVIRVPVKSSLNITCDGSVYIGSLQSDQIRANTISGNITIQKCHCEDISLCSKYGNIVAENVLQAANITLKTLECGDIKTGRLQGLNLEIVVEKGNIETESSYCDESVFTVKNGNMTLNNLHKNVNISAHKSNIKMIGLNGKLELHMTEGNLDLQVSNIENHSRIMIHEKGNVILRLSESCQSDIDIKVKASLLDVDDDVKLIKQSANGNSFVLKSNSSDKLLDVDCKKSKVNIKTESWADMLMMNYKKRTP